MSGPRFRLQTIRVGKAMVLARYRRWSMLSRARSTHLARNSNLRRAHWSTRASWSAGSGIRLTVRRDEMWERPGRSRVAILNLPRNRNRGFERGSINLCAGVCGVGRPGPSGAGAAVGCGGPEAHTGHAGDPKPLKRSQCRPGRHIPGFRSPFDMRCHGYPRRVDLPPRSSVSVHLSSPLN